MKYCRGIYGYFDTNTNKIVYIGKDSHIDKKHRHTAHISPSRYDKQKINMILQKNPLRYAYCVIATHIKNEKELNFLEKYFIKYFNPKFNFTEGGDGVAGFTVSEETKAKLRKRMLGRKLSEETKQKIRENTPKTFLGKHHTEETKRIISEKNSGENSPWWGKKHSEETKRKISLAHKGRTHSRASVLKMRKNRAKYTLWNASKATYVKQAMYNKNKDLKYLRRCFLSRYEGQKLPIGFNLDFLTCEIINDLIKEACE